jgi:hypothetical protein
VRLPERPIRLGFPVLLTSLCAFIALDLAHAEPTARAASPTPAASNAVAPASLAAAATATNGEKMDLPVPVGEPIKGIKIPQYDEQGKLTMNLVADSALKLDERQVEFKDLKIQFSDKEEKEIVVEIPHSILNLETKILSADTKTIIHREDFEIIGQQAEFDTVARTGKFKGPVHASFRNSSPTDQP